jgi:hypothetical protein
MITEIGIAAGDIWRRLDQKGRLELPILVKSVPGGSDLALMALGWLSREGHVVITQNENQTFVELREKKAAKSSQELSH